MVGSFRGATGTRPPGPTRPAPTQLKPSARTWFGPDFDPISTQSAVSCESLRFSAKICGFLRFPAPSKCFNFQEKGWICENLRVFCENMRLGSSPDLDLKSPFSGPNQVEIRSKLGPGRGVQLGRCRTRRSGWGGPCSSSGKSLSHGTKAWLATARIN